MRHTRGFYQRLTKHGNITVLLGTDQIDAIEALVAAHLYDSRSDFIRQALDYFKAQLEDYIADMAPATIAARVAAIRREETSQ